MKKLEQALLRDEERQADCFWHDNSVSVRYLLVLPGVPHVTPSDMSALVLSQTAGSIKVISKEYQHLTQEEPGLLPWQNGPVSIMLVI